MRGTGIDFHGVGDHEVETGAVNGFAFGCGHFRSRFVHRFCRVRFVHQMHTTNPAPICAEVAPGVLRFRRYFWFRRDSQGDNWRVANQAD